MELIKPNLSQLDILKRYLKGALKIAASVPAMQFYGQKNTMSLM